ncbi:MAG TPA: RNA polymerase sigma factor [Candidatus Dormibacteraeota bacterium]|nr:RNA polymerase sigma factor [Candidatus Dormibacteraeota bacterium]
MAGEQTTLLRDAVAGDERAFDALIGPLVDPGYKLAVSILENREEAEDAVQEATIKAWRNLHQLKDASVAKSWFFTIVANQCRSVRRSRWWSVVKLAAPEQPKSGPEDEAVQRTDLERALRTLSPDDRLALYLRYYMDLPLNEVASVLGVSETAAKSRIHRAAQGLRPAVDVPEGVT